MELKNKLRKIAANLIANQVSSLSDDYPRFFPRWVLKNIEQKNERYRLLAVELIDMANSLKCEVE